LLDVQNLACSRGDRPLFRNLAFRLTTGQLLHVQGQNGCGKTTLLRTLCGLTAPDAGTISWNGRSVSEQRDEFLSSLIYIGHQNGLNGELSGQENLNFESRLAGAPIQDHPAALAALGLGRVAHLPTKLLSQGQKRRTALSRLIMPGRRLWILDEPLSALDANSCQRMLASFTDHLQTGGMIVLTSHQEIPQTAFPVMTLVMESS